MMDTESWISFGNLTWILLGTVALAALVQVVMWGGSFLYHCFKMERKLKDFPGPPGHWLHGTTEQFESAEEQLPRMLEQQQKYGTIRTMKYGLSNYVVDVSDPDSIQAILTTTEPKQEIVNEIFRPYLTENLLLGSGPRWARMRKLLTNAFHFDILQSFTKVFAHNVNVTVGHWKKQVQTNPRINISEPLHMLTFDNLAKCALGFQGDDIQTPGRMHFFPGWVKEIKVLYRERYRSPMLYNEFIYTFLTSAGRRYKHLSSLVHNYSLSVIKQRRKEKSENKQPEGKKFRDLVDILLEARDADGVGLTDDEIRPEVDAFMFAGHDTVASGITWFLYNMATHPVYQKRCYDEVMEILGDREEITWDDISKMEYTTMCIKESLRRFPPVGILERQLTRPLRLPKGLEAPEGVWLNAVIWCLHRNPDVWENPDVYDPERFSEENNKNRHPYAFVPFSAGPRNCIGKRFAMTELKVTVATLLRNFEFSYQEKEDPVLVTQLTIEPKDGMTLTMTPRTRT